MKKTLVAVAALVATGAFAEATIYGTFEEAYTTGRVSNAAGAVTSTTNGLASPWAGNGVIVGVKAGEDLGEGLKLSGVVEFGFDINNTKTTSTPYTRQSFVALGGAFGQVRAGRQYSAAFSNAAGIDAGGATSYGTLYQTVITDGTGLGESPLRQSNNIQYDLPNFVPGLNLGMNIVRAGANTASGVASGDGTGFNANYTNGGLYVGYTTDNATATAAGQFVSLTPRIAASNVNERKLTTTAASYNFGVAKIGYLNATTAIAADKIATSMFVVSAPIGAATVYVESSNGTQSGATAATLKGTEYGVNYALSARTTVYGRIGSTTISGLSSANNTAIGIQHSF